LGVTFGLLLGGVVVSLVKTRGEKVVVVDQSPEQPASADRTVDQKEDDPQMRV
jgi:tellurite resistance protein TerC